MSYQHHGQAVLPRSRLQCACQQFRPRRVYRQISAEIPEHLTWSQFEGLGADPEEVVWVLEDGKRCFLAYQQKLRDAKRRRATMLIFAGLVMFCIGLLMTQILGWPTSRRQVCIINNAILGGLGGALYGRRCWSTAESRNVRRDFD